MLRLLAACVGLILVGAADPAGGPRSPEAQAKLDKWLEGRVAGETRKCVTANILTNAIGIDDRTMLFRDGPRIWRNELRASLECGKLGKQAFIHTESAANRICNGQQLEFEDGGITGACVLGDFTPYTKAK
jgi:hypothetical protein